MKWIKAIFTSISIMLMGMFGGQKEKGIRRFGIAGLSVAMDWKRGWPMIFLIPVLVMGYGDKSILMKYIGIEWLVRVVYALLLSLPFMLYSIKRSAMAFVLLTGAFLIHAPSIGYISWFGDILLEDIIRYGTLGVLISFNLFF